MRRANDFLLPAIIIVSDQNQDGNISLTELRDVMAIYNWIPEGIRYILFIDNILIIKQNHNQARASLIKWCEIRKSHLTVTKMA